MNNYKIVIGEIYLRDGDSGEVINEDPFPIVIGNILTDSPEIAKYLIDELGVKKYKLIRQKYPVTFLEHELN